MYCSRCGANVADGTAFCSSCGLPIAGYSVGSQTAQAAQPAAAPTVGGYAPQGYAGGYAAARPTATYAGFWLRFVAVIIDWLVWMVPIVPLYMILILSALPDLMSHPQNPFALLPIILPRVLLFSFLLLVGTWLYWALLESSAWQATLGKKALGLTVTDLQGNRVTFGRASGRFFAGRGAKFFPYIGWLYYLISCICAGFTEKKQAIHDMIAGCLVIRKI